LQWMLCCRPCLAALALPLQPGLMPPPAPPSVKPLGVGLSLLSPDDPAHARFVEWFAARAISVPTLQRNRISLETRYCAALGRREPHIAFPFYKHGVIVNVKYRALDKFFSQSKGGEQVLYGYDGARVSTRGGGWFSWRAAAGLHGSRSGGGGSSRGEALPGVVGAGEA
jgi:hypothetical protein